jgi:hypothetical protein
MVDLTGKVFFTNIRKCWVLWLVRCDDESGVMNYRFSMRDKMNPNSIGFCPLEREINLEGIKRWISRCNQDHAGACHTVTDTWTQIPIATGLRFIDVERLCLVKQPENVDETRYAALSYVWGATTEPFQTVQANIEDLSQHSAFTLPHNRTRLPKTIADSIMLTRALGIRYLWVDRFCIVQDDKATKPHQLTSMASIYSNAYVTIAATEGNCSNYGLPGANKERLRNPPVEEFQFSPICDLIIWPFLAEQSNKVYHTRGWTFQEWTFSPRTIVFHDQSVSWLCRQEQENEDSRSLYQFPAKESRPLWSKHPYVESYCVAVQNYSKRSLTYPEDILAAFNAFMTVQGRAMEGDIIFGIPELFFHSMLCWHHDLGSLQQRRTDSQGNILKDFPSWSWAGWLGPVDMSLPRRGSGMAMRKTTPPCLSYPHLVDFFNVIIEPRGERKERVKDLHYYETCGLTRFVEDRDVSSWTSTKVYSVSPVVSEDKMKSITTERFHSTIIGFRTRRLITSLSNHNRDDLNKDTPILVGPGGQMIGTLDLKISLANLQLPQHHIELICISMSAPVCKEHALLRNNGAEYGHFESCSFKCFIDHDHSLYGIHTPASNWQFRYYDVLWIEWEDGIAYRKAIGQVWKEDWDAADTEEVDIRLG